MKKLQGIFAALIIVGSASMALGSAKEGEKASVVEGEVIDVLCYLSHEGKGDGHATCATNCVKGGLPVGILENGTNKVYLLVTEDHKPAQKLMTPHVAKQVKVTGKVIHGKGVTLLLVDKVEKI